MYSAVVSPSKTHKYTDDNSSKEVSPHLRRRRNSFSHVPLLRIFASFLFTFIGAAFLLRHRYSSQVNSILYPVTDNVLIKMAEEDISAWDGGRRRRTGTVNKRNRDGAASAADDNDGRPKYQIPGPSELRTICPQYECSVVHIDTRLSNRRGPLVRFVNKDFDHIRLLWYGCSLNRAAVKLQREGVQVNSYFVLNLGDGYVEKGKASFPIWSKAGLVAGGGGGGGGDGDGDGDPAASKVAKVLST